MGWLLGLITGRRAKWLVLVMWIAAIGIGAPYGGKLFGTAQDNYKTYLPTSAESTKLIEALQKFPGGDTSPMVVVYQRDSGVTAEDRARAARESEVFRQRYAPDLKTVPVMPSPDGQALLYQIPISLKGAKDTGVVYADAADDIRKTVGSGGDGLNVKVTGAAAETADQSKVFDSLEFTLLLVPLFVVAALLLLIYRSPVLFIFPLLSVVLGVQLASATVYGLVQGTGLTVSSLSVSVFNILLYGAGTDYALLVISRYREELRRHEDRHEAMRVALRRCGPAIVASAATIALGLLCLLVADQAGTRGLGPIGAVSMAGAVLAMMTLLPVLLLIVGRWVFWPVIPRPGTEARRSRSMWPRVGRLVQARPQMLWVLTTVVLGGFAVGLVNVSTPQHTMFRSAPDSVIGQSVVEAHFPAGAGNPIAIVAPAGKAAEVMAAARSTTGVTAVGQVFQAGDQVLLQATNNAAPNSAADYEVVKRLRGKLGPQGALVGGESATNLDKTTAAIQDGKIIIPLVLVVILLILCLLLRALLLPALLILTVALSFGAALGLSSTIFEYLFHWHGVDAALPLQAFVFLVALGVDYNIFLMSRVREEAQRHGTRAGTIRGLVVTGGVITSAGVVLAATFGVLASLPAVAIAHLGFVVALGVLLDTLVVRSLLVPALVLQVGDRVWWPGRLSKAVPASERSESLPELAAAGND